MSIVFLDTEFTDLLRPELHRLGLVTLDCREHCFEFDLATEVVAHALAVAEATFAPPAMPLLPLLGAPGFGKSYLCRRLTEALYAGFTRPAMDPPTSDSTLPGSRCCQGSQDIDMLRQLDSALEPEASRRLTDVSLDVSMDAYRGGYAVHCWRSAARESVRVSPGCLKRAVERVAGAAICSGRGRIGIDDSEAALGPTWSCQRSEMRPH